MAQIYEYMSYRDYLKDRLEALGPRSGLKRRAAEALGVHTTFISQVANGKAELSLEQAEAMNSYLKHDDEEGEYFINLVIYERAGNTRLKQRYEEKIQKKRLERTKIKPWLEDTNDISAEAQERFYSSHLYGLIHVLVSVPTYQTEEALTKVTGLPESVVKDAVQFMLEIGVLKESRGKLKPGAQHVHLDKNSNQIWQHHRNWRTAVMQRFAFSQPEDLNYSLTFSCSEQDAQKLRESLLAHLKSMTKTIAVSKEEAAYVYCFDFVRWG